MQRHTTYGVIHRISMLGVFTSCLLVLLFPGCSKDTETPPDSRSPTASATAAVARAAAPGDSQDRAFNISYIPPDCMTAVIIDPQPILKNESVKLLPIEVAEALATHRLGIDIYDIEEVIGLVRTPRGAEGTPDLGAIIRFSKAYQLKELFPGFSEYFQPAQLPGGLKALSMSDGPITLLITMPDDTSLLVGTEGMVRSMLKVRDGVDPAVPSSFITRLKQLDTANQIRVLVSMEGFPEELLEQARRELAGGLIPPAVGDALESLLRAEAIDLQLTLDDSLTGRLTLHARNADEARHTLERIKAALVFGRQLLLTQGNTINTGDPIIDEALGRYLERISAHIVETVTPELQGDRLVFSTDAAVGVASIGTLTALLLPAVAAAREAARKMSSSNNLKQIALALRIYHNTYGHFPTGVYKDGKPLLSWRVQILPFMEQDPLYNAFHMDEAWNSPHNLPLSKQIVPVYVDPRNTIDPNLTTYLAPIGPRTVLGSGKPVKFRDVSDGESQVILVLEVGSDKAVPWAKPDDWHFDEDAPIKSLGNAREIILIAMVDGSVHSLVVAEWKDILKLLVERNDGQSLPQGYGR
jgi:hypothetical protein